MVTVCILLFFTYSAPSDYTSISRVLIFSNSSTVQTVQVPIVNDLVLELNEVFIASLSLENFSNRVKLVPNSVSVTINDDDGTILNY